MHIVEEPEVARAYLRYWELLSEDPASEDLRPTLSEKFQLPEDKPPEGTVTIFSRRNNLDALK